MTCHLSRNVSYVVNINITKVWHDHYHEQNYDQMCNFQIFKLFIPKFWTIDQQI